MYKALIFSDRFFTPAVFEWAISQVPFWRGVQRVYYDLGWPEVPFCYGEKTKEYVPYPQEVLEEVEDATILVTQMGLVDECLLQHAPNLQVVGCLRSGPVNVDREALARRGIPLFFAPERSVEAVAEFTIGLFIAARRGIVRACREASLGIWSQSTYFNYALAPLPLSQVTVGLIGFGRIARKVAQLLGPFGVREVMSYDPFVPREDMEMYGVRKVSLEELLQTADIVSLHVRCTEDNRRMIGEREFGMMKPGSIFVNTSRGELVNEEALVRALQRGIPAFACIDTCCEEPWSGKHPLAGLENIILTPHIAGASRNTVESAALEIARAIGRYFEEAHPFGKRRRGECFSWG